MYFIIARIDGLMAIASAEKMHFLKMLYVTLNFECIILKIKRAVYETSC